MFVHGIYLSTKRLQVLLIFDSISLHQLSFQKLMLSPLPRSQTELSKVTEASSLILLQMEEEI
jgi:hypothetical protein